MTEMNVAPDGGGAAKDVAELIARYDGRAPRYTSYPTAPHFSPAVGASVYARWLGELPAETPLSLYLHVPFCDRLCLYCGCNTSVVRLDSSHRAYAALLMREIDHVARLIGRRAAVSHVHCCGGTPTSLPGLEVDLDAIAAEPGAVEGGRVRRIAVVRGGRPRVLGRAAHRGQRTRAALRAVDRRPVRPLSRPPERQAAPRARGLI
jgi:hypothetical protein